MSGKGHYSFLETFNNMIYNAFTKINIENDMVKKYVIEYMVSGMTNARLLWIKNDDMSGICSIRNENDLEDPFCKPE